jgi:hypothetical protein
LVVELIFDHENPMFYIKVKALGLDYFKPVSQQFNAENIEYNITYDSSLRSKMHTILAYRTNQIDKNEYWACYGYNENRLAITQLAKAYFPSNEHSHAGNLVNPHTMIKFNLFKKGYIDAFVKYLESYGLGDNYYKAPRDFFNKDIFSVLTIPIESPLHFGKYKEILQQHKIQGMVCYGNNLKTEAYSGYAQTQIQSVYYIYGVGNKAPIIEAMAKIYFDNISSLTINNLPKNYFCIPYTDIMKGYVYGFDEVLIRSGVNLHNQKF